MKFRLPQRDFPTPTADRRPHTIHLHGHSLTDDYFWLRRRESQEVLDHLTAENAFTESMMASAEALQQEIYGEMRARMPEDDCSVPVRLDDFLYYHRTEKDKQYSIYCRRKDSEDAEEEILLDLNQIAGEGGFLRLGVYRVSPDHRYLAYSLDRDGSEQYVLRIKDLDSGSDLPEQFVNTAHSAEWVGDGETLIYTTRNAAHRPYRAFSHRLGEDPDQDLLLFEEGDERFFLSVEKTRSRRFIILRLGTHTMTELHVLDTQRLEAGFTLLAARRPNVEFSADHHGDRFLMLTNLGAADFRLMEVPLGDLRESAWREVLAERPKLVLEDLACFSRFLVLEVRRNGLRGLEIYTLDGSSERCRLQAQEPTLVSFDQPAYTVRLAGNVNFESPWLRFVFSSFVTPRSVFDYHMESGERKLLKREEVVAFNSEDFVSERLFATAQDGESVPISVVRKKDVALDGNAPLLLYGYGSYGTCIEPRFSSARLSLLDRGVIYAIAHIRGGGAFGRGWYEAGKLEHKAATFSDFEAAAELLIRDRHTCPRKLMIRGASAGGLLIGAVINRRPELFHAALAEVPFVDVLNTMLDPTIPLTVIEFDEWGNPGEDEEAFRVISSYSPYDNLKPTAYPHLLVTAGLHDPRVQYWEPAKWVAKLRSTKRDENVLLLKTDMVSGHGGASGRFDALEQEAFKYAFLLRALETDRVDVPRSASMEQGRLEGSGVSKL